MWVLQRVPELGAPRGGRRTRDVLNLTKGHAHTHWRWDVVESSKLHPGALDRRGGGGLTVGNGSLDRGRMMARGR